MRWLDLVAAGALVVATAAPRAEANGRNPHTVAIYQKPGDPQTLYVSSTFGLLISKDGGCTFDWSCEQSIGYGGTWDPQYAIANDGTIFATTFEGLRISRDGACSFTTAAATANLWIDALTIGPTGEIWVGTAETGGVNDVLASTDNGATFTSRGMQSAEKWWKGIAIAPSRAQRVYVTGYQVAPSPSAFFYRSDDGGANWTPSPLANVMYGGTPVLRVRTVDKTNPDIVYMASEAANPPSGDRLYRSTDGGETWTEVLTTDATIHDVLVRDTNTVIVSTQVRTASSLIGGTTYRSTNAGVSFTQLTSTPRLACITQLDDGTLLGCGANWEPDFKAVARSADGGESWEKVWRFVELNDAVQCPEGTVQHDTCDVSLWDCPTCGTDLKRQFGAKGPACGVQATDGPPKKNGNGCCSTSGDPLGALWAAIVLLVLRRRR